MNATPESFEKGEALWPELIGALLGYFTIFQHPAAMPNAVAVQAALGAR
jgi:hypothetical protein